MPPRGLAIKIRLQATRSKKIIFADFHYICTDINQGRFDPGKGGGGTNRHFLPKHGNFYAQALMTVYIFIF